MKTTSKNEEHHCPAVDALTELCDALGPLVATLLEGNCDSADVAKNINPLVLGAKSMAEVE